MSGSPATTGLFDPEPCVAKFRVEGLGFRVQEMVGDGSLTEKKTVQAEPEALRKNLIRQPWPEL